MSSSSDPNRKRRKSHSLRKRASNSPRRGPSGQSKSSRSGRREVKATSSFSAPQPSRASVETVIARSNENSKPVMWTYLVGMLGLFGIMYFDGGNSPLAMGFAVLLTGLCWMIRPPQKGVSAWVDLSLFAVLGVLAAGLLPLFYWPEPEWRIELVELYGLELPATLSIHPLESFEIWIQIVAAFGWFYAMTAWPLNQPGRVWVYFACCTMLFGFGVGVASGGMSFLPAIQDQAFATMVLSSGAVLAFVFAVGNLRSRDAAPVIGLLTIFASLGALYVRDSGVGFGLFILGVLLWYLAQIRSKEVPGLLKIFLPIGMIGGAFLLSLDETMDWGAFGRSVEKIEDAASITQSTVQMIVEMPLTGIGLGNFAEVLPQYTHIAESDLMSLQPENDLLGFAAEGGIFGILAIVSFVLACFWMCRPSNDSGNASLRLAARIALITCVVHLFLEAPLRNVGAAYFALFLLALALPSRKKSSGLKFPKIGIRAFGAIFVLAGAVWVISATFRVPIMANVAHVELVREVREANRENAYAKAERLLADWIAVRPLDSEAYFLKGEMLRASEPGSREIREWFDRARAVLPFSAELALKAGAALANHDSAAAMDAWERALELPLSNVEFALSSIIEAADKNAKVLVWLFAFSKDDPSRRAIVLSQVEGRLLNREMDKLLLEDPELSLFSRDERTKVVMNWVRQESGDRVGEFLDRNPDHIDHEWWVRSIISTERERFEEALAIIRGSLDPPSLPSTGGLIRNVTITRREFTVNPRDFAKGGELVMHYFDQEDFQSAYEITEIASGVDGMPSSFLFWRAEALFRLGRYPESWYTFERFVEAELRASEN